MTPSHHQDTDVLRESQATGRSSDEMRWWVWNVTGKSRNILHVR